MEFDFHVHSRYSFDSKNEPSRIVAIARRRGLRGVAITDHDSVEGGLEGMRFATDGFIVIPGIEVTTEVGDMIGLFIREPVLSKKPEEFIDGVHKLGGIVFLPHPFRYTDTVDEGILRKIDAIEGYNGRSSRPEPLDASYGEPKVEAVARPLGLPVIAGSDAHIYAEIGRGRTLLPATRVEEIRDQILKRNTLVRARKLSRARRAFGGAWQTAARRLGWG